MGGTPLLSVGAQAAWGSNPRRAERLPVLGAPFVYIRCLLVAVRAVSRVSAFVYMCVHKCPGSGVRVCGNPLRPCFPFCVYLCLSLSSFARGMCDSCYSSSVFSSSPFSGAPYPDPLPSLLPSAP